MGSLVPILQGNRDRSSRPNGLGRQMVYGQTFSPGWSGQPRLKFYKIPAWWLRTSRNIRILRSNNPRKPESWITKAHMETFGGRLQKHLMSDNDVEDQLYMLAKSPSSTISTFQGYAINGNTFYTIAQDKKSTNQNSSVRFDAATENGQKVTYYCYIEEIWELDYRPSFKVPLFRCKWFKLTGGGVKVDEQYRMTMVDFNNLGYLNGPFVLAKDVVGTLD
ncbi:hypothetical protein QYE76_052963 [Lolium multiflorum]|uniref:DUF4216 domain-containing protein n=1 Tax=Lolium multiflorum TaxID=4521 RepID=A0AAD8SVJ9_LOLMU|nr:hypothetical protein QYE76_052963 [Lolium multiflorum]